MTVKKFTFYSIRKGIVLNLCRRHEFLRKSCEKNNWIIKLGVIRTRTEKVIRWLEVAQFWWNVTFSDMKRTAAGMWKLALWYLMSYTCVCLRCPKRLSMCDGDLWNLFTNGLNFTVRAPCRVGHVRDCAPEGTRLHHEQTSYVPRLLF